jgi:hypothetical protein
VPWGNDASTRGKLDTVSLRWPTVPENDDARAHKSVGKLKILGIKTMYSNKLNVLGEIAPYRYPVIDIHEFTWYEPAREPIGGKPLCREHEKMAIQPCQARNLDSGFSQHSPLQPNFVFRRNVMVARIRRIGCYEIESAIRSLTKKI